MSIINQEFKNLYKTMIDELLGVNGLTNKCTLYFNNNSTAYCHNCLYDKASEMSSNVYNGSGPAPFDEYTICPVCMGSGKTLLNTKNKTLSLAVIFDSKYFLNLANKLVNIPEGTVQIIAPKNYAEDLKTCSYLVIDAYPSIKYERIDDINLSGLGDLNYIFLNWRRV